MGTFRLMTHSLIISFTRDGENCFFSVFKGNIMVVTTDLLPTDKETCLGVLASLAAVMQVSADEQIGLKIQLEAALQIHADEMQRRVIAASPFATKLFGTPLGGRRPEEAN